MKRFALSLCLIAALLSPCAAEPPTDPLKQAQAAANERRFDEALSLYESAMREGPQDPARWYSIQSSIARTLAKKGDFPEAAKAAHLCLDGAPNLQSYGDAVTLAASIFSAWDQNIERANQFLEFQQSGAGHKNPMATVGYPALPDREAAFAEMRRTAGDAPAAARLRAYTYLYSGKPMEALAQFADCFRRSSAQPDIQRAANELVTVGLRAARGHAAGLPDALAFVLSGPNGPDGKPNTADDLPDPFGEWIGTPLAPGSGGLATLSPAELAALRQVRDGAELYAADAALPRDTRSAAFAAIQRTNDALDNWGANGQEAWYLRLLNTGDVVDPALLTGAQAAARGRALHLGGVSALWATIQSYHDAQATSSSKAEEIARTGFNNLCNSLKQVRVPNPPQPLKRPATF